MPANNTQQNLYERIQEEIERGDLKQKLWLRCYAEARGNDKKAVSIYLSRRAEELYRENTGFLKRTLDSGKKAYDFQSPRGKKLIIGTIIAVLFAALLIAQPFLHSSARQKAKTISMNIHEADILGKNQQALFEQLGPPTSSRVSETTLIYIYNPSSALCFGRSRYELRVFVGGQGGTVSGFQIPPALETFEK